MKPAEVPNPPLNQSPNTPLETPLETPLQTPLETLPGSAVLPSSLPALLPLYTLPSQAPDAWRAAEMAAPGLCVVLRRGGGNDGSRDGGNGGDGGDAEITAAVQRLNDAGAVVLGCVDTSFATRPVADLLDEVNWWADQKTTGVFLDQTPTSPFSIGPVALATRMARRGGLTTVVLNPAGAVDALYRELGVAVCTFEGPWADYLAWDGEGSLPGDGHLVHSVPVDEQGYAWELLQHREAGFGLVTDRSPPDTYAVAPAWLLGATWAAGGAGSGGGI